jgi:uncharacterized protein (DUF1330 family)
VVIEFESYEQALACYRSAAYQEAKRHREGGREGGDVIVEGLAPFEGRLRSFELSPGSL